MRPGTGNRFSYSPTAPNLQPGVGEAVRPGGHTLLLASSPSAINATLYDKLNYNFLRDIAPVAAIVSETSVLVVHPSLPVQTVPEFIAYAKANPGKISMASSGVGAMAHMSGELFKLMTGIDMIHVPYRGTGPALTDLLSGQVQAMFSSVSGAMEFVKTNRLRALAITTAARSESLPNLPTIGEFVPGYEANGWNGIGAPRDTPVAIINQLNREINEILIDPRMKVRLTDLGSTVLPGPPADFGKLVAEETEKWGKVIRAGKIRAE